MVLLQLYYTELNKKLSELAVVGREDPWREPKRLIGQQHSGGGTLDTAALLRGRHTALQSQQ